MRDQEPRYAIYYSPESGEPLWLFGCDCIGYDAETGLDRAFPRSSALSHDDWLARTHEPRRYGFHATLKAPFHLAEGKTEAELIEALSKFVLGRKTFSLIDLNVRAMGQFVALTLLEPNEDLQLLAQDCVTHFDLFRAPLGESDLARRLLADLSERQKDLLQSWGYPYVMEQFRFHMTLTSSLPVSELDVFVEELAKLYQQQVGRRHHLVKGLSLFRQETRDSRFRLMRRFPFTIVRNSRELT